MIRVDAISYVDFLDSGRAMIFMPGLNQEKQMISIDVESARKLRESLEARGLVETLTPAPSAAPVKRWQ